MKKLFSLGVILFSMMGLNLALADSHAHSHASISFEKAWARPTIGNSKNTAVYLVVKNRGKQDITITSAQTEVSARVELHTHIKEGDVMKMRPMAGGLKVPAGGKTELKPGGDHLMLLGLKQRLEKGDHFIIDITTAKGKTSSIKVSVEDKGPIGHDHKK